MKKITKEEAWVDTNGAKYYRRVEKLVSDYEYDCRKYCQTTHRTSFGRIFDAYRDYIDSMRFD